MIITILMSLVKSLGHQIKNEMKAGPFVLRVGVGGGRGGLDVVFNPGAGACLQRF